MASQTRVPYDYIGQLTENQIIRFAGNDKDKPNVQRIKELLAFSEKLLPLCTKDGAASLTERRLDAFFLVGDYDSAITLLESGKITTRTPLWCKGTAAKLRAHKAMDAKEYKEAIKQLQVFGEFMLSDEQKDFEDCDPTTGIIYSREWVVGKNYLRCRDLARDLKDATLEADYFSVDVFSPHIIPFARELMARYKALGADGGMRDEWGFIPDHAPSLHKFWWSPNFEAAYRAACGRSLMDDFPLMALGAKGDAARAAAIGTFMKLVLARNVEIERDFYETDKRLFGAGVYVAKHPTWHSAVCPQEYFHNGLDWWQAPRDWAQGDENAPIYALNAMAKKFGGPVWLNEGYTATPERNVFRVWTYAMCGGRQVYHGLYSGNPRKEMAKYEQMSWDERRVRTAVDLLASGNVTAQTRVRLPNLISRAQVDAPVAYVFGHERLVDWSGDGWNDHGQWKILKLMSQGWWCDAYPASECGLGTFTVDGDGYLRVGQQRYLAVMLHNLSTGEKGTFDAVVKGHALKTRIFGGDEDKAVGDYLQQVGTVRQPLVKGGTKAGHIYPEPDGTLRLIDGTAIRIRADWDHPCGLPIAEAMESNGVKVEVEAEGLAAVRAENGQVTALAAGGLRRVAGPGLALALDRPEDVVLLKIGGEWHGIWQTIDANGPIPAPLAALTKHWMRLVLPPHLAR